jgi:hypothetical protein
VRVVPCEIYSRVVGYYAPVSRFNLGKKAEFVDRLPYDPNKQTPPVRGSATMRMALVEEGVIAS